MTRGEYRDQPWYDPTDPATADWEDERELKRFVLTLLGWPWLWGTLWDELRDKLRDVFQR